MEGNYEVFFGSQIVGKVQVTRRGLYYRFCCRCQLTGEILCRLYVTCGDHQENLGIVVPMGDSFGLETGIAVKRLGEGPMTFSLKPKHPCPGTFVPICPEEPFAYIARLKDAYLDRRDGQPGAVLGK